MRKRTLKTGGFSLLEVMAVVGIVGLLSSMAQTMFVASQLRSHRAEAEVMLEALQVTQFAYYAGRDHFAPEFSPLEMNAESGRPVGTLFQGKKYAFALSQPWGEKSWYCSATANLDGDPWPDMMVSFEKL